MDVLRAPQSNRPRAAVRHATVALSCAGADAGAAAVGGFVSTECSLLLLHAYNVCVCVLLAFTTTFISYAFLPVLFHAPPCRLLGCLSSDCAKVDSLCAQNACFVKKVKNSNCVSSCFSKAMYNHAKTRKIYPVGLNKTPIAGRIGVRASRSPPIRTPKILQKKKWRAFPLLFNTNRKYVASAYPSAKHNFKNCGHFLCQTKFDKRHAFALLFNTNPKHLKQ